jgi:hypothetical protein
VSVWCGMRSAEIHLDSNWNLQIEMTFGSPPVPFVMIALVAAGTLNSSAAYFSTAVNGASSGTLRLIGTSWGGYGSGKGRWIEIRFTELRRDGNISSMDGTPGPVSPASADRPLKHAHSERLLRVRREGYFERHLGHGDLVGSDAQPGVWHVRSAARNLQRHQSDLCEMTRECEFQKIVRIPRFRARLELHVYSVYAVRILRNTGTYSLPLFTVPRTCHKNFPTNPSLTRQFPRSHRITRVKLSRDSSEMLSSDS